MASLLIKNLPDTLHHELKRRAERHHRSLNKELIALIEAALARPEPDVLPAPAGTLGPMTQAPLDEERRQRAACVLALRGKYRTSLSSSEEFAARKADEIELENASR